MKIPVYALFAASFLLLSLSSILWRADRRRKRKGLGRIALGWQVAGTLFFLLAALSGAGGAYVAATFEGEEAGERRPLLSDTLSQKDVLVITDAHRADDKPFSKAKKDAARAINRREETDAYLSYTDQFYNKKTLYLRDIASADGDPSLSAKKVKITQYLVREESRYFSMYRIRYALVFGTQGL